MEWGNWRCSDEHMDGLMRWLIIYVHWILARGGKRWQAMVARTGRCKQEWELMIANRGRCWHQSVSPTLLRSYPPGQVRRKEKHPRPASTPPPPLRGYMVLP